MLHRKALIATLVIVLPLLSSCGMSSFTQTRPSHALPKPLSQSPSIKQQDPMSEAENSDVSTAVKMGIFATIQSGTVYATSNGYRLGTIAGGTKEEESKPYLLPDGTPVQGLGASFAISTTEKSNYGGSPDREVYVGPGGIIHLDDVSILVIHVKPNSEKPSSPPSEGPPIVGDSDGWVAIKEIQRTKQ
jgi:hypothetical protein